MIVPPTGEENPEAAREARRRSEAWHHRMQRRMWTIALVLMVLLSGLRFWQVRSQEAARPVLSGEAVAGPFEAVSGDTVRMGSEIVRVSNLDAPAMGGGAKCAREAELAEVAKTRLDRLVSAPGVKVELIRDPVRRTDDVGRSLARVIVDGEDVAVVMIEAGLARLWRGRSSNWCPV